MWKWLLFFALIGYVFYLNDFDTANSIGMLVDKADAVLRTDHRN